MFMVTQDRQGGKTFAKAISRSLIGPKFNNSHANEMISL